MVTFASVETQYETAQVLLPGGIRLHYVHGGPKDGAAVIMLHGYSDSSFSYSRVLPLMPAHLRVFALDQRGHGQSDRPPTGYSIDAFASDVIGFMDVMGIDRATVVGHSMGSFIARRVAEKAPGRVERLVLIGTALNARNRAVAELRAAVNTLTDPVDVQFIREFQKSTIRRPVPAAFFEQVVAESRRLPAAVWKQVLEELEAYEPGGLLTCPTIILGGREDAVFSCDEQTAVFLTSERCTLHLEPGIGHSLQWEAPERFIELAFGNVRSI